MIAAGDATSQSQREAGGLYYVTVRGDYDSNNLLDGASVRVWDEYGIPFGPASTSSSAPEPVRVLVRARYTGVHYVQVSGKYTTTTGAYSVAVSRAD